MILLIGHKCDSHNATHEAQWKPALRKAGICWVFLSCQNNAVLHTELPVWICDHLIFNKNLISEGIWKFLTISEIIWLQLILVSTDAIWNFLELSVVICTLQIHVKRRKPTLLHCKTKFRHGSRLRRGSLLHCLHLGVVFLKYGQCSQQRSQNNHTWVFSLEIAFHACTKPSAVALSPCSRWKSARNRLLEY